MNHMNKLILLTEFIQSKGAKLRDSTNGIVAGDRVRVMIDGFLSKQFVVVINFDGIETMTPSFCDEAFGKLVEKYPIDVLSKHLTFTGNEPRFIEMADRAIKNRQKINMAC